MNWSKAKGVVLDIVSFGSPQAIVFNICSILFVLAAIPTSQLNNFPIKCVFKQVILPFIFNGSCPSDGIFAGCSCPACGLTRGVSRLLHGDLRGALSFNRLAPVVLFVMVALIVINVIKVLRQHKKTGKFYEF